MEVSWKFHGIEPTYGDFPWDIMIHNYYIHGSRSKGPCKEF